MPSLAATTSGHDGSIEVAVEVPLSIVVRDIGATTAAEVWVGDVLVSAFRTYTRHPDVALRFGHEVRARALRPLLEGAVADVELTPWDPTGRGLED